MEISYRRVYLSQPTGVSTFAIHTSQRSDEKLQKSLQQCYLLLKSCKIVSADNKPHTNN